MSHASQSQGSEFPEDLESPGFRAKQAARDTPPHDLTRNGCGGGSCRSQGQRGYLGGRGRGVCSTNLLPILVLTCLLNTRDRHVQFRKETQNLVLKRFLTFALPICEPTCLSACQSVNQSVGQSVCQSVCKMAKVMSQQMFLAKFSQFHRHLGDHQVSCFLGFYFCPRFYTVSIRCLCPPFSLVSDDFLVRLPC